MPKDLFAEAGIDMRQGVPAEQPRDLFQGKEIPPQIDQQVSPSVVNTIAQSIPVQALLGAGDAAARAWSAGLLHPQLGKGTAYNIGNIAGNIGAYLLPGAALKGVAGGVRALAPVSEFLEAGGPTGIARRVAGSALFGAATDPYNRLSGAKAGAMLGGIGEAVPIAGRVVKNITSVFRPQEVVKDIVETVPQQLSKAEGTKNVLYDAIHGRVGNSNIYSPLEDIKLEGKFTKINKNRINHIDDAIKDLNNDFNSNPNYENAHLLQSEIGKRIRSYEVKAARSGPLVGKEFKDYVFLNNTRNALNSDIRDFLGKVDPELAAQHELAKNHFIDSVLPNRNASEIIKKAGPNPTTKKIIRSFEKAKHQGKEFPPYIEDMLSDLHSRQIAQNIAQKAGGALLGLSAFRSVPMAGEVAAAGAGALFGTPFSRMLSGLPLAAVGRGIGKAYRPISQGMIANILNPQGSNYGNNI